MWHLLGFSCMRRYLCYLSAHLTILNQEPFGAASPCTGILIYFRTRKYFQPKNVPAAYNIGGFNRYIDWNTCVYRNDCDEAPFPKGNGRTFKYPIIKCRYRNRCGYHALICAFHVTGIHFHVDSTRNFRITLYHFKCHAEISAAG